MRMPGNFADVAHKNGVAVATQSTTAYGADMTTNGWGEAYFELGGTEESRNKVLAYLDYYGIDGIGYNSEFAGGYDALGVKEIVKLNEAISKHFAEKYTGDMKSFSAENIWYDGVTVAGSPRFDNGDRGRRGRAHGGDSGAADAGGLRGRAHPQPEIRPQSGHRRRLRRSRPR